MIKLGWILKSNLISFTIFPGTKSVCKNVCLNLQEHDSAAEDNLMDRLCQLKPSVCNHTTTEPKVVLVKRSS